MQLGDDIMNKNENFKIDDLIKKIDLKIAELEKCEKPDELLRKSLLKKGIIKIESDLTDEEIERLFDIIKTNINKN